MKKYDENTNQDVPMMACESNSTWGGSWTEQKLNAFEKYVRAYLTIMNKFRDKYRWELLYLDGFAGSGTRSNEQKVQEVDNTIQLFEDDTISQAGLDTYKGAAERVLSISGRGFDYYYFIDKEASSLERLEKRLENINKIGKREFRSGDANEQVKKMASALKNKKLKALVLLDPFGMQVNWESIQQLKDTGTDLWILVPTGVIVNRLLDRKGELTHIDKLTSFFGKEEDDLREYFYKTSTEHTLFGDNEVVEKVSQPIQKIAELYIQQLQDIFTYVTPKPLVLRNSRNTPIFHFVFASNNNAALKIANDIISE